MIPMAYNREEKLARTRMVLGEDGLARLARAHVAVVGLGGVGSYAAEAIARAGVGEITLLDADTVSVSNINRQLCARESTVGQKKTAVTAAHIADLFPDTRVHCLDFFYSEETRGVLFFTKFDYVIDCIDTVTAKTDLIVSAKERDIPIVSALGTGNKLDPTQLEFSDIYKTSVCPLARAMRQALKKRGIAAHDVLYSRETPTHAVVAENGRYAPGSIPWVPGCAGLMLAGFVVRRLIASPDQR